MRLSTEVYPAPVADADPRTIVEDWATSGAMALTGSPTGPPRVAPGWPATFVREGLARLGLTAPGLLGERAAYTGLRRAAPWSCGGASRILRCSDGEVVLTLSRPSDLQLLPALTDGEVGSGPAAGVWAGLVTWARERRVVQVEDRLRLLDLPGGEVRSAASVARERPGVVSRVFGDRRAQRLADGPLIVDLSALWAGPLCSHLLQRLGARVVTVEDIGRPDPGRAGAPAFHALLRGGHDRRSLDFRDPRDVRRLRELIFRADLVLEASRPRALRRLGLHAEEVVATGTPWISITARGRGSAAVGFGDDVAASAGLVLHDPDGGAQFVGDAMADPLTGVAAALAARAALGAEEARLVDVSMAHVAAGVGGDVPEHEVVRRDDGWWVATEGASYPVREPRRR